MKFLNSILFAGALIFSQFLCTFASPIKRTPGPFEEGNSEIYFKKPENWGDNVYAYVYTDNANSSYKAQWPGVLMGKRTDYYSLIVKRKFFPDFKVIFTDGVNQSPASMEPGFDLVMEGVYDQTGILGISYEKPYFWNDYNRTDKSLKYGNVAKIYYRPNHGSEWGEGVNFYYLNMFAHYKAGNGEWNDVQMELDPYTSFYSLTLDLESAEDLTLAFTDNEGHWDNNGNLNYNFKKFSNFIVDNSEDSYQFKF